MCVKAIQIDETAPELYLRILALILDSVRYHVKKLMHLGYLRQGSAGYEVTEKVLFLNR